MWITTVLLHCQILCLRFLKHFCLILLSHNMLLMSINLASKSLSTALCTDFFKKTVDHYRKNGSHIFTCFIDFNKAFDNVDYWLLFCNLLDNITGVTCNLATRLLAYWYSNQVMCVKWHNTESQYFKIANEVRRPVPLSVSFLYPWFNS